MDDTIEVEDDSIVEPEPIEETGPSQEIYILKSEIERLGREISTIRSELDELRRGQSLREQKPEPEPAAHIWGRKFFTGR